MINKKNNLLNSKFRRKKKRKTMSLVDDYSHQENKIVDYKNTEFLSRFINRQGRIISRKQSKLSQKEQKQVTTAIKRARQMALMPYEIELQQIIEPKKQKNNQTISITKTENIKNE